MKVENAIIDFLNTCTGDILVAVSGGRDSMVLLHAITELNAYLDRRILVCHVNHMLRGTESDADQEFVEQSYLHVVESVLSANIDVGKMEGSMETNARSVRYEFFAECAKHEGVIDLVLAHHADDQVETVLYNLCRGSAQLKGMQQLSQREINGVTLNIHRPLLKVSRKDIDAYVKEHGVKYREDSTNTEPVAVRNRIRNEVIPLLSEIMQRDVSQQINAAVSLAQQDNQWIESQIESIDYKDPQGRLFVPKLQCMHEAVLRRVLVQFLTEHDVNGINGKLIKDAKRLLIDDVLSKVNLPGGGQLCRKEKRIFIKK